MTGPREEGGVVAQYGLVCAWLAVTLVVMGLLGFFITPARGRLVAKSVNAVLERSGDNRRLSAPASRWGAEGRAGIGHTRFSLEGGRGGAVVFTVNGGGVVATCVAMVDGGGKVEKILPLDAGSFAALERLPRGLLQSYAARIEAGERSVRSKEKQ